MAGKTIPEMLGFLGTEEKRRELEGQEEALSQVSYQALYILYEDEAEDLLDEYAPTREQARTAHPKIVAEINRRFMHNREYRNRVLGWDEDERVRATFGIKDTPIGGYQLMEKRMRSAGVIPHGEAEIVDTLNAIMDEQDEDV